MKGHGKHSSLKIHALHGTLLISSVIFNCVIRFAALWNIDLRWYTDFNKQSKISAVNLSFGHIVDGPKFSSGGLMKKNHTPVPENKN